MAGTRRDTRKEERHSQRGETLTKRRGTHKEALQKLRGIGRAALIGWHRVVCFYLVPILYMPSVSCRVYHAVSIMPCLSCRVYHAVSIMPFEVLLAV